MIIFSSFFVCFFSSSTCAALSEITSDGLKRAITTKSTHVGQRMRSNLNWSLGLAVSFCHRWDLLVLQIKPDKDAPAATKQNEEDCCIYRPAVDFRLVSVRLMPKNVISQSPLQRGGRDPRPSAERQTFHTDIYAITHFDLNLVTLLWSETMEKKKKYAVLAMSFILLPSSFVFLLPLSWLQALKFKDLYYWHPDWTLSLECFSFVFKSVLEKWMTI